MCPITAVSQYAPTCPIFQVITEQIKQARKQYSGAEVKL